MQVLFQQWTLYCASCESADEQEDPWDIEFKNPKDCDCRPKYLYEHDDKVWCRCCGRQIETASDN